MAHSIFRGLLQGTGGGGGGGGFTNTDTTPPALGGGTGCRLYVAAGHGLYTDAGTTLATASAQTIYRWKDYSGSNNHLDQTTSGFRPTAGTAAQVVFAGSPHYLAVPGAVGSGVTDGELFGLVKVDNPAATSGLWWFGGGDVGVYPSVDGNVYEGSGTTGRYAFTKPSGLGSWHVWSVRTSGTTWQALKDNTAFNTQAGNTPDWTTGNVGASISQTIYMIGQFAACAFYAGARSAPERASIVAALLAQSPP